MRGACSVPRRHPGGIAGAAILVAVVATTGCSTEPGSGVGGAVESSSDPPAAVAPVARDAAAAPVVEGLFDVGGHELYLNCAGIGGPTVVYLHGSIENASVDPHTNATDIQDRLRDHVRVCLYDRRNTGHSDTVDAVQTPQDAMTDMRRLLGAAGIEPPYVLLGASFGGSLAYLFANTYPEDVSGMVLLDPMFPDELALEHLFPQQDRYKAFVKEDECCILERIAHYKVLRQGWRHIGHEPEIPLTFLASEQEPRNVNDYGIPEYDDRILDLQAAFVDRFSPGKLVWVDAPHFMEPVIPDEIAAAVLDVIQMAG